MSFKSRDLMVKLSESGQGGCGEHTKDCGLCTQATPQDGCTATGGTTKDTTKDYIGARSGEREGSGTVLALLRRQLRETLARPQI